MSRLPGELITKDPSSVEVQGFDWTAYLADLGEDVTIALSTFSVTPSGLTLSDEDIVTGSLKTVVTLEGGTVGTRYRVTNHVTLNNGGEDDRSFYVLVQDR